MISADPGRWSELKGALYQILLARHAVRWGPTVGDAMMREWYQRRAQRCLERAFSTIYYRIAPPALRIDPAVKQWLMPRGEEQDYLLLMARDEAAEIVQR